MMCGFVINLLSFNSRIFLGWLGWKKQLWMKLSFGMAISTTGILLSWESRIIGKKRVCQCCVFRLCLLIWRSLMRVMTRFFGLMTLVGNLVSKVIAGRCTNYKGLTILDFPTKAIWKSKALTKACCIVWAATKGRFQQGTCLKGETSSWLAGVLCVLRRTNQQTTFLWIGDGSPLYGICLFLWWGLVGCNHNP